jgi:dGTPase
VGQSKCCDFYDWISKYWDISDRESNSVLKNKVIYFAKEGINDYKIAVIDFVSGMADQFALRTFSEIITF